MIRRPDCQWSRGVCLGVVVGALFVGAAGSGCGERLPQSTAVVSEAGGILLGRVDRSYGGEFVGSGKPLLLPDGQGGVMVIVSEDWRATQTTRASAPAQSGDDYRARLGHVTPELRAHRVSADGRLRIEPPMLLSQPGKGGLSPRAAGEPGGPWLLSWVNKYALGSGRWPAPAGGERALRVLRADGTTGDVLTQPIGAGEVVDCRLGANPGGQLVGACGGELFRLDAQGALRWRRAIPPGSEPWKTDGQTGASWLRRDRLDASCPYQLMRVTDLDQGLTPRAVEFEGYMPVVCGHIDKTAGPERPVLFDEIDPLVDSGNTTVTLLADIVLFQPGSASLPAPTHPWPHVVLMRSGKSSPYVQDVASLKPLFDHDGRSPHTSFKDGAILVDRRGGLVVVAEVDGWARADRFVRRENGIDHRADIRVGYLAPYLTRNPGAASAGHYRHLVQTHAEQWIAVTSSEAPAPFEVGKPARDRVMAFDWDLQPLWSAPVALSLKPERPATLLDTAADGRGGIWVLYLQGARECRQREGDGWWNCGNPLLLQHISADGQLSFK